MARQNLVGEHRLIARTVIALLLWGMLSQLSAADREIIVPLLAGNVFADGRPINRTVMIRLESLGSAIAATTYNIDHARFAFRDLSLMLNEQYSLVVRDPGYMELRYDLNMNDFVADSAMPGVYVFTGLITLNLESLPPDNKRADKGGPKIVDARQFKAEIPSEARREYNLALSDTAEDKRTALAHLEKAVALAPDYYDALNRLGAEYLRVGEYRKSETVLNHACALNPYAALPLINLGILYLQEGESLESSTAGKTEANAGEESYRKAINAFEKAQHIAPLVPRTALYLGNALYKTGAYDKAESAFLNALALDDKAYEARLMLVNIYIRQQRYDAAFKQISAYLKTNPNAAQREQMEALKAKIEKSLKH
jgi:tetratricopeptide (TPR) repeat protein